MSHTRLIAFALAATMLATTGCGGSAKKSASRPASAEQPAGTQASSTSTEASAPTGPLTRAELIASADAICKRLGLQTKTVKTTSLHGVGTTAPTLASYYRTALAELRRLTPPAAAAGALRAIVAGIEPIADEITVMGRYAIDNDIRSTVRVENHIGKVQLHRFAVARRLGFKDCAEL